MRVLPQRTIVALAVVFAVSYGLPQAQTSAKKVMGIDDYTKWRSISGSELSGDGNWVTYVLQLTNTPAADAKPVLHLPGEGHGLRGMANRKDLTTRYFQFFDHYLKDAPAPKWLTEGVPYLKKNDKDPSNLQH